MKRLIFVCWFGVCVAGAALSQEKRTPKSAIDPNVAQQENVSQTLPAPDASAKAKKNISPAGLVVSSDSGQGGSAVYVTDDSDCKVFASREERVECLLTKLVREWNQKKMENGK